MVRLRDDLVLGRITTANVYAFIRSDAQGGVVDGAPTLVGYLHYRQRELVVDRRQGSLVRAFASVWRRGTRSAIVALAKLVGAFTLGHSR